MQESKANARIALKVNEFMDQIKFLIIIQKFEFKFKILLNNRLSKKSTFLKIGI
mgnify:CR=1 FL=1|jgi:hypothetical protein